MIRNISTSNNLALHCTSESWFRSFSLVLCEVENLHGLSKIQDEVQLLFTYRFVSKYILSHCFDVFTEVELVNSKLRKGRICRRFSTCKWNFPCCFCGDDFERMLRSDVFFLTTRSRFSFQRYHSYKNLRLAPKNVSPCETFHFLPLKLGKYAEEAKAYYVWTYTKNRYSNSISKEMILKIWQWSKQMLKRNQN